MVPPVGVSAADLRHPIAQAAPSIGYIVEQLSCLRRCVSLCRLHRPLPPIICQIAISGACRNACFFLFKQCPVSIAAAAAASHAALARACAHVPVAALDARDIDEYSLNLRVEPPALSCLR